MRRVAAALAAVLALLPAGCGSGSKPRPRPSPTPTATPVAALLQQALDARAATLGAAPRARALGVRDLGLTLEQAEVDGDRATVRARLSYEVRGLQGTFGGTRTLRARRRAAAWRVGPPAGARARLPWQVDRYARTPLRHFVVWTPPGIDPAALDVALEDAYARMRRLLRATRLSDRYLVVVARDAGAARSLTRSIRGLGGLTALTDTEVREEGPTERVRSVTSQRLIVIWAAFTAITPDQRRMTITHELVHAALAPRTSGRVPGWLSEGLAMYVSGDRRAPEAARLLDGGVTARASRRALTLRGLTAPDAVARLGGEAQRAAYAYASAAAFAIAARDGRAKLLELYEAFNRDAVRGAAGEPGTVDAAVERVLGTSLAELDRQVRRSLRGT